MKKCSKCKIEKSFDCFSKHKNTKDKLNSHCKQCTKESNQKNPEYYKKYREENKEYYHKKTQEHYQKDPSYYHKKSILWRKKAKQDLNKGIIIKVHENISNAIRKSCKDLGFNKNSNALEIIGLKSWEEFRKYIESYWEEGMSWDNYGKNYKTDWSIDHTIPKSSATTLDEVYKLNHYTNLKPMWHIDNVKKNNKQ